MRYELRKFENNRLVWDTVANGPAVVEGCWQMGLVMDDADDLTDLLNLLDSRRKETTAAKPTP
jgi:hypothetical protein